MRQYPRSLVSVAGVAGLRVTTTTADELAHGRAGQLGHMADVSPKPPKWRMTRTLRQGYLLAAVWLIIGLPQLVTFWASGSFSRWLRLGVGVFATILGAGYLVTTLALRRRGLGSPPGPDTIPRL